MRFRLLTTLLRWLAAVLIVRVFFVILSQYPNYFPPRFDSLFLEGREDTFHGLYRIAFYVHILTSPFVLLNGLLLLVMAHYHRFGTVHRILGRLQVIVLLLFVLPSAVVMSRHAFAGWPAGISFLFLSLTTAICAIIGVIHARNRHFMHHQVWMQRTYVLICSAVVLRLISGALSYVDGMNADRAYIVAAWLSWLLPLAVLEGMRFFTKSISIQHFMDSQSK